MSLEGEDLPGDAMGGDAPQGDGDTSVGDIKAEKEVVAAPETEPEEQKVKKDETAIDDPVATFHKRDAEAGDAPAEDIKHESTEINPAAGDTSSPHEEKERKHEDGDGDVPNEATKHEAGDAGQDGSRGRESARFRTGPRVRPGREPPSRKRRMRETETPEGRAMDGSPTKWRKEDAWKETLSPLRNLRRATGRRQRSAVLAQRKHCCPFLLRVYASTKGVPNEEELQVYTWLSATMREVVNLVKDVLPEVRDPSVRLHMKFRSYKTSELTEIGTLSSAYQSAVDRRSLVSFGFKIGDIIYVEVDGSKPPSREETEAGGVSNENSIPTENAEVKPVE